LPEGDTILWAATQMRPVLEGHVPDQIRMPKGPAGALRGSPGRARWPARLAGRNVTRVSTHGKNLLIHFDGGLVLRSHLRMTGAWGVFAAGEGWHRPPARAWIVLSSAGYDVVEFDGPVLELMTEGRVRFDQHLAALGPDVLADELDTERFISRLRGDDQTRPIGDALIDQRNLAGIGNIWKSEGCWEARIDPSRVLSRISNDEAIAIVTAVRPRMLRSGLRGPRHMQLRIYNRAGRPCPRCGAKIISWPQGEGARMTYACPGCQA
jgi:endonuclease-8